MFIAIRDLRFAKGRFALLAGVVALMTLMVVMLSGLTAGLGAASVSAIDALAVDYVALQRPAAGQELAFATSGLPASAVGTAAGQRGVTAAYPLGITTTRLTSGDHTAAATAIGTDPALYPKIVEGTAPAPGQIAVSRTLATDNGLRVGDAVTVGATPVTVGAIVADTTLSHLPTLYAPIATWQAIARTEGVTAVALRGDGIDRSALDAAAGTSTVTLSQARGAVAGFSAEQGSLNLMRVVLLAISALIVGAFFTVWTMQRGPDLAVVRAIGARRGYLLRDAVGQAAIVLLGGAVIGAAAATGLGALATRAVPFVLDASTVALPLVGMVAVGLIGAVFSVRRVTSIDPLTALGGAR